MPKRFPTVVVIELELNDKYRFFYGIISFRDNIIELVKRGLRAMDIFDLVIGPLFIEFNTVFHHYYGKNIHLSCSTFTSETVAGKIEVKYWGSGRQGQIGVIKLIITKCEVPKVVFT